ncbi:MAG: DUF1156 domain-containing protein, partial [Euryarchaeota archaeon]|nr:DUF1156 domain-containing protein [Euryarchaeota archaeon]
MMNPKHNIIFTSGNMLEIPADIRVNSVNCIGVMGAGVALAFKNNYPEMYKDYQKACKEGKMTPGKLHVWKNLSGEWIINFPTKRHYKEPSRYEDIKEGLIALHNYLLDKGKVHVALPALGCGHGGLDWERVKVMIEEHLGDLEATFIVFEPSDSHMVGNAYRDKAFQASEEKLVNQGVNIIQPNSNLFPLALKGRTASSLYVKGNDALLKQPILTILSSLKPDEREIKVALSCLELVARPGLSIMVGYGHLLDRPIIIKALELGADVIIALPEGLLNFGIRNDIKDVWDEHRIVVLTLSAPNQIWNPQAASRAKELSMAFATAALITDCNPQWLSRFVERKEIHIPFFYINYDRSSAESLELSNGFNAKPIGEGAQINVPHVTPLLEALGINNLKSQLPAKSSIKTISSTKMEITSFVPASQINEKPSAYDTSSQLLPGESKVRGNTMTSYPKRLIEVDLPIKKISEHSRREKSIRHGHISTLHIWWARRPLAACRAVICAALWVDPADPLCPEKFRRDAAVLMKRFFDPMSTDGRDFNDPMVLRHALLDFIADFANWDNSTKKEYLETSRALTQSAHESLGGAPGTKPLVVDPFAGGGSIPLEALRVGADAFASDLNPVAVLLNKVVLEYIPKYGQCLADEVRKWGEWIKHEAEKELVQFYPKDLDGATPIAYLWARTITCEGPGCGAEVPLMRSLWLAKKDKRSVWLRIIPNPKEKKVDFEIIEKAHAKDVGEGTVRRGSATCMCCGFTTPVASVRKQLKARRGGAADARLFAVVTTRRGQQGRFYRLPTMRDLEAVRKAADEFELRKKKNTEKMSLVPDEPTPQGGGSGAGRAFSQRNYGMDCFADLFTPRQVVALTTLAHLVHEVGKKLIPVHESGFIMAIQTSLAMCVDKVADLGNAFCPWEPVAECPRNLFARQAIPMGWNFGEGVPIGESSGSFEIMIDRFVYVLEQIGSDWNAGHTELASAIAHPLPNDMAQAFITDPPYYDAVPYADLSDFFYVWLKRMLLQSDVTMFTDILTPKDDECIVDEVKGKDRQYFELAMTKAMAEGRRILIPNGIGIVVFANKSTEGWEAQLQAMIEAGWTITSSWPIDTEMASRFRARDSAALGSSVHIAVRPRENPDGSLRENSIGDWRDVLQELPVRIHEWMPRLAQEKVVGADAIFACLGPALEIFSRYSRVEKASGDVVPLKEYLEHVWAAVAKEALEMIFQGADATGFEEDARLTAMWLWTLSTGANGNGNMKAEDESVDDDDEEKSGKSSKISGYILEYDAARKIAQGLGVHLEQLSKLVEIKGDKARLLPVEERTIYLFGKEELQAPKRGKKKEMKQL